MVEAQSWTTRRISNPRFDAAATTTPTVIDIPGTPPHSSASSNGKPFFFSSPHGISLRSHGGVAAWFGSNIGVLLLNKYLLFYYGFRYPIFLTMTHTLSCAAYSSAVINIAGIMLHQHILSRR
ncbi:probable sugar phosphate/phosphate translocator At1g12500 [Brassica rapa]|uniref:probable sugar phosphate/phosphate translocator At1g12500 n=1 Tax=Brassica campestris TaxID=3711 RepID=UPI0004F1A18B|nr:probable sugar phosphate/phosphate translocator At1g12500 [Brassica rapa]